MWLHVFIFSLHFWWKSDRYTYIETEATYIISLIFLDSFEVFFPMKIVFKGTWMTEVILSHVYNKNMFRGNKKFTFFPHFLFFSLHMSLDFITIAHFYIKIFASPGNTFLLFSRHLTVVLSSPPISLVFFYATLDGSCNLSLKNKTNSQNFKVDYLKKKYWYLKKLL